MGDPLTTAGPPATEIVSVMVGRVCHVLIFATVPAALARALDTYVLAIKEAPQQSSGWKQLGKCLLDAGETASAYRVFRAGASACPGDTSLSHYRRVYDLFHTELDDETDPDAMAAALSRDSFVSIAVPAEAVPAGLEMQGNELVHASTRPCLSRDECARIIAAAERTASRRGWTTDRHPDAPTCDIPAYEIRVQTGAWLARITRQRLLPCVSMLFARAIPNPERLRCQDCFIVRYDGNDQSGPGFASLRAHQDESRISVTIALNDQECYKEGGLWIAATGDVLNGDAGTMLCFAGELVHAGFPVREGTRWILTMFFYIDENLSGKEPGTALRELHLPTLGEEAASAVSAREW